MDGNTLTDKTVTLVNTTTGATVSATVSYDSTTKTVTLDPSSRLAANTRYEATITASATDKAGNSLAGNQPSGDYTWYFTTGSK
jgi:hypothetical protein